MAELHVIGQIQNGRGFGSSTGACCRWNIDAGSDWKLIAGRKYGQTQVDTPTEDETAHQWCHPVDVHFATKSLSGWPKFIFEVRRQDQFGRNDLAGYATCHVPSSPGIHILEIPTWRPVGTVREEVVRYFLGGAAELNDRDFIINSPERYRLKTVPSGVITAEISVIHRNFEKFGVDA